MGKKYKKYVEVYHGEKILIEGEDGEIREGDLTSSETKYFKSNRTFMKLFLSQDIVADKVGDDYKYIAYISSVLAYDNSINMIRFADRVSMSRQGFYALRKRLMEKGIIKKIGKEYFLNPLIGVKSDKISYELSVEFHDINKSIYEITNL